jgi:Ion channel
MSSHWTPPGPQQVLAGFFFVVVLSFVIFARRETKLRVRGFLLAVTGAVIGTVFGIPDELHREIIGGLFLLTAVAAAVVSIRFYSDAIRLLLLGVLLASAIGFYTSLYMSEGICTDSDCQWTNVRHDWRSALYFSIITFTTTGYGDYHPTEEGRLVAASEALAGYIFFGMFVSLLASYFGTRSEKPSKREQ